MFTFAFTPAFADEGYQLVQAPSSPAEVKPNKKVVLSLTVLPHAGNRLLADGPVELRVSARNARALKPALHREDAVDPRAEAPRFELPIAVESIAAEVSVDCVFYLCAGARCRPVTTTARWSLSPQGTSL
jgi:hypothetical protein